LSKCTFTLKYKYNERTNLVGVGKIREHNKTLTGNRTKEPKQASIAKKRNP